MCGVWGSRESYSGIFGCGVQEMCCPGVLTPISIKNNPFLRLILLEQTPLLTCFGLVTPQKWLVSRRINLRKALFLIDVGVKVGGRDREARMPLCVLGVRVLACWDSGSGFRVLSSGLRVQGSRFWVLGLRFWVQALRVKVCEMRSAQTLNGVTKSSSQIYCCHGRVAL